MRLLLIEDNREIAGIVLDYFEAFGHQLDYTADGRHGLELASEQYFDVIILDIMLPGMDGYQVCRELRKRRITTPVLMLTARDTTDDTLQGFEEGADDYLVKPFDLKILEARVKALVRRNSPGAFSDALEFEDLTLDLGNHSARRGDRDIPLNPTCFTLLKLLISKSPDLVTREEMIYAIWGDEPPDGDALRNHIYQLRVVVDKPFEQPMITTVPKVGYRLQATLSTKE